MPLLRVDRYLAGYVARRRAVALARSAILTASFVIGWMLLCSVLDHWMPLARSLRFAAVLAGSVGALGILALPIASFFRRYNPAVAAAIEIEQSHPVFDQRLITIASAQPAVPLLMHLQSEVESILTSGGVKARVSLLPLLLPILVLTVVVLLWVAVWRFPGMNLQTSFRWLRHPLA